MGLRHRSLDESRDRDIGGRMDLLRGATGAAVAIRLAAIAFLRELLRLAFPLVVEDDAAASLGRPGRPRAVLGHSSAAVTEAHHAHLQERAPGYWLRFTRGRPQSYS